jgi:Spy/CpxP family protein refolding chaperone
MQTKTLFSSLAVVALLAVAAVSYAGPNGPGRGGYGCPGAGSGYGPSANLTDEQQAALKTAYEAYAKKVETVGQDLYAKNLELEAELAKSAPDSKKVATLTKEVNDLRGKVFEEQVAFRGKLAKDFGIRGGYGMGRGMMGGSGMMMGRGMMMGQGMMGSGYGPGNCPAWGAPDADDKTN